MSFQAEYMQSLIDDAIAYGRCGGTSCRKCERKDDRIRELESHLRTVGEIKELEKKIAIILHQLMDIKNHVVSVENRQRAIDAKLL